MSLVTNIQSLATRVATECKALRTLVNGNATDLSALTTTSKTNLVSALNELKGLIDAVDTSAVIDDAATNASTTKTWSASKISAEIGAEIDALVNGASASLDTIKELADALQNNPDVISELTTAVAKRVRFDAAQTLTTGEKTQARTNIGAAGATEVGDTTADFVATFNGGLSA